MFKLPIKAPDFCDNDSPIISIKITNQMIEALFNKLPCQIGPWKLNNSKLKLKVLVTEIPENIISGVSYM